jgi:ABC-type lipoprotein export system ATPase subunit
LLRPSAGQVLLDGQDPYQLSPDQRARLRCQSVGFVFQQFHLVGYLSVRENILSASLGDSAPADSSRCDQLIEQFGLQDRAGHRPGRLSVGEKQRTALARALLNRPRLLLADEPTGNLDAGNARIVLEAMDQFAREGGSVLLVTHDERAADFAHDTFQLNQGRLLSSAPA